MCNLAVSGTEVTDERNKKVSARLRVYLRLESTNHQKIGEIIEALQIHKSLTQTASL